MYVSLKKFWQVLDKERKVKFVFISILMVFGSVAELISIGAVFPFIAFLTSPQIILDSTFAINNSWLFNGLDEKELLFLSSVFFIVVTLLSGIIRMTVLYTTTRFSLKTGMIINDKLFRKTLYQPYLEHTKSNSSETISALTTKSNAVCFNILIPSLNSINSIMQLTIICFALLYIEPFTSLIAFIAFGSMYFFIIQLSKKRLAQDGQNMAIELEQLVKHMQEALGGIKDLIINNTQEKYLNYFGSSDRNYKRAQGMSIIIADSPRFIVETIGISIIIVLAYWLSSSQGANSAVIPILGTIALGAQRLLPIIQLLFRSWAYIKAGIPALEDLLEIYGKENIYQGDDSQDSILIFEKFIEFKNISFKYNLNSSKWILEDINLKINKGEVIGIYGTTGSGKSTFIDLFSGLIAPLKGSIKIDNQNDDVKLNNSWKKKLTYVPQSIFLIDSSIKDNILFGLDEKDCDQAKLNEVIDKAKLTKLISKLPDGVDTIVGERGLGLSGGERQRIGIARALYRDTEIMIFDESTNSLDISTEEKIIDEIFKLKGTKTILMIAHRLSTIERCDRFLKVDDRRIIETNEIDHNV